MRSLSDKEAPVSTTSIVGFLLFFAAWASWFSHVSSRDRSLAYTTSCVCFVLTVIKGGRGLVSVVAGVSSSDAAEEHNDVVVPQHES